jgi:hypothetical protein
MIPPLTPGEHVGLDSGIAVQRQEGSTNLYRVTVAETEESVVLKRRELETVAQLAGIRTEGLRED